MACDDSCQRPTPSQAHCGACHRTFGGVHGFDAHRRAGECLDPAELGMAEIRRVWRRQITQAWPVRVPQRATDGPAAPGGPPVHPGPLRAVLDDARHAGEAMRQRRRDQADAWREARGPRW